MKLKSINRKAGRSQLASRKSIREMITAARVTYNIVQWCYAILLGERQKEFYLGKEGEKKF